MCISERLRSFYQKYGHNYQPSCKLTLLIEFVDIQQNDAASFERFACHSSGGTLFQIGYSLEIEKFSGRTGATPQTVFSTGKFLDFEGPVR